MNTLAQIIDYKKQELASHRRKISFKDVQKKADDAESPRFFLKNFKKEAINIIAEIKKASPSAGVIRPDFRPLDIARIYEDNGARALSVLTDEHFFQGSLSILTQTKAQVALPCLRKDFTLDAYHVYEARGAGADAILLIAAVLEPSQLKDYRDLANELGMETLFEIHDPNEWKKIELINPALLGVNNRNLQTFETSLKTSLDLIDVIRGERTVVSESGLNDRDDLLTLQQAGFDGFLIGETLMREKDIGKKLKQLVSS